MMNYVKNILISGIVIGFILSPLQCVGWEYVEPNDALETPWAIEAMDYFAKILKVDGQIKTYPNCIITRGEGIKMIIFCFDLLSYDNIYNFIDVDKEEWYYYYICSAYHIGLIQGNEKGEIHPEDNLTREDAAHMIYKICNILEYPFQEETEVSAFEDEAEISEYAKDSVVILHKNGIIQGEGEGYFCPKEMITRAEMMQMCYNALMKCQSQGILILE